LIFGFLFLVFKSEGFHLADLVFGPTLACRKPRSPKRTTNVPLLPRRKLRSKAGLTPKPHHAHPRQLLSGTYVGPFACDWLGLPHRNSAGATTDLDGSLHPSL